MFLSESPQEAFRSAEIIEQNAPVSQGSRASFRASEIVAQNTAVPALNLPRLMLAGVSVFLLYNFVLKGLK